MLLALLSLLVNMLKNEWLKNLPEVLKTLLAQLLRPLGHQQQGS